MLRILLFLHAVFCFLSVTSQPNFRQEKYIDVSGKKQFCVEEGSGDPAVVFLTGLGVSAEDLLGIQDEVSQKTRTLNYDKAGIGKSEGINRERTLENLSSELKELLGKAGFTKPLILVGHSRGGYLARYFAYQYPQKVCGLILLDPPDPQLRWKRKQLRTEDEKKDFDGPASFKIDTTTLPPAVKSELKQSRTSDSAAIAHTKLPADIPVTIIASVKFTEEKYSKEENVIKTELLQSYLKDAPQIKLMLTDRSGHFIYEDEPELVMKEIGSMLDQRKKQWTNRKK